MRKTYRSKKDASGALDHKDVLLTMDERSSAFDAFYIQNIKQTKREMSSVNFLAAPPSKVRKRKYVKRILKDPEPPKESALYSVYLTPNKSLHVNKPLDLFDQLLNSPSTQRNESLWVNKGGLFGRQNVAKTYRKKKVMKRYNYSSSDTTESDKENSDSSKTPDTSNIKKHKLLIESAKKGSPFLDKSIKNLVQNFSILKKTSPKTPGAFKFVNNRLTTNIQSPILQNSPLCSTPFKEKYRGESIYKFSPINSKIFNEMKDVNASHDNSNDSIIIVEKEQLNLSNNAEINPSVEMCKSPVFKTPDIYKAPSSSKDDSKQNITTVPEICVEPEERSIITVGKDTSKLQEHTISNNGCGKSDNEVTSSIEICPFLSTEVEPFLGFSNNEPILKQSNDDKNYSTQKENIGTSQYNNSLDNSVMLFSDDNHIEPDINEGSAVDPHNDSSLENSVIQSEEADLGNNEENDDSRNSRISSDSENESDLSQLRNITVNQQTLPDDYCVDSDASNESPEKKSLSQNSDNESMYDTCDSGETTQCDSKLYVSSKLPVIALERLEDSVFQKYYSKFTDYNETDNSESCQDSDDYESVENISDISNNSNESNSENVKESSISDNGNNISNDSDTDSKSNTDEDRCISFVTTRRRNEVTNDSMILAFNDSYGSVSSVECDKTVLSNNRNINRKSDFDDNEATIVNEKVDSPKIEIVSEEIKKPDASRLSNVVSRNNARKSESIKDEELKTEFVEPKPSIILQPGKKWERSLSIYRRMTTINDHFDHSILEDEPMQSKGRKYRQSVISTMEMQDKSILHNESLNSRRSTFVSKPYRSTIKIVKEPNNSRISLCATAVFDDLKGFLNEDCDDTIVELSKLSIADSEHEVTVLENFHDAGRIATAKDYVLRRCIQTEVLLFDECYPDTVLKNCHKIGEGVYGEVFLWRARDGRARVMKIVPIAGVTKVNGESQKDYHEIISEIVIAMELSALRAPIAEIDRHFDEGKDIDALDLHPIENATDVFNEVLAVKCVYGSYPSRLLDLWELYDECKGSENDNPAILPVDQQYIVLELANAGQDLESYQFNSAEQAHALFLQVAFALAVGEESFQFEHRDLHWGNVLISPTDQKFATFVLRGRLHRVARCGVAATIIDYSLSRISLPLSGSDSAALYNDLSTDDGLFDAVGDYQFEVYRRMRDKLGNDWKNFEPYTNILWLHYTVDKMITALRYKRTNTKIHKHYIAKLKGIKNRILDYGSAAQFVLTDNEF